MAIYFLTTKPRVGQGDLAGQKEEDYQHPTISEDSKERMDENRQVEAVEARNFKIKKYFMFSRSENLSLCDKYLYFIHLKMFILSLTMPDDGGVY